MMRGLQLYPTKADGLSQADGSCEPLTQPIVETPLSRKPSWQPPQGTEGCLARLNSRGMHRASVCTCGKHAGLTCVYVPWQVGHAGP